ncbi:hypothetical protein DCC35_10275 [Mangrovivirga cuniculi]|uniref:histidine kinase n=2 Tax=Mangrovivirga cuniculi TaxID=2715131 RepID=A0A4D7JWC4_9BACT|nr:hypothetical protein DCC35_10275 [Mangrovivirga cuniculi]
MPKILKISVYLLLSFGINKVMAPKYFFKILLLNFFFCFLLPGIGNTVIYAQNEYKFHHLSVEDGLSQTAVTDIVEDDLGFIWISTQNGLNKYDGKNFRIYRHSSDSLHSIPNNSIRKIKRLSNDQLAICTHNGLSIYDYKHDYFKHYKNLNTDSILFSGRYIVDVEELPDTRLVVAGYNGYLSIINRKTNEVETINNSEKDAIKFKYPSIIGFALFKDDLVVSTSNGLKFINTKTFEFDTLKESSLRDKNLLVADFDKINDSIAIITSYYQGAYFLNVNSAQVEPIYEKESFQVIETHYDSLRNLFLFGTQANGLISYDPKTKKTKNYRYNEEASFALKSDQIYNIYQDSNDNIWFATTNGVQVCYANQLGFENISYSPNENMGLNDKIIWGIAENEDKIFIGTQNHGVNIFNKKLKKFEYLTHDSTKENSLSFDGVTILKRVPEENGIYIGTEEGLNFYNEKTGKIQNIFHEEATFKGSYLNYVGDVISDDKGNIYTISTFNLNKLNKETGKLEEILFNSSLDTLLLNYGVNTAFINSSDSVVYLGTPMGLIKRDYKEGNTFGFIESDKFSLKDIDIFDITSDSEGNLLIATDFGLAIYNPKNGDISIYNKESGLPVNIVYDVLIDQNDQVWVTTDLGISRFSKKDETFINFDKKDGISIDEFNENASYFNPETNNIFFGGLGGITYLNTDSVSFYSNSPKPIFTDLFLFNERVIPSDSSIISKSLSHVDTLFLNYDQSVVSIKWTSIISNPDKNIDYEYRMVNFDKNWIEAGEKSEVTYTNLEPGKYILQVKAINKLKPEESKTTEIVIFVKPPFWKTLWFYALVFVVISTSITSFIYFRIRKIKAQKIHLEKQIRIHTHELAHQKDQLEDINKELQIKNDEMEKFTYTVSHDLKSPLVTVQGFVSILKHDLTNGNLSQVEGDLDQLERATGRMQTLINDLLELSRIGMVVNHFDHCLLDDIIEESLSAVKGHIHNKNATIVKSYPSDLEIYGDKSRLLQVFQNLIENALKYMGSQDEPQVEIGIKEGVKRIFYVKDNGAGIAKEHQERIFNLFDRLEKNIEGTGIGLALVDKIVTMHNGKIWVESDGPRRGSTFYFTINLKESVASSGSKKEDTSQTYS